MKVRHVLPWLKCIDRVRRADKVIRDYFDIDRKLEYKVKYDPSTEIVKTEIDEKTTTEITIGGFAKEGEITFPGIPSRAFAEHEVLHLYHLGTNASLIDFAETQDFGEKVIGELCKSIVLESIAYGFNSRDGTKTKLGQRGDYSNDEKPLDQMSLEKLKRLLKKRLETSVAKTLFDFSGFSNPEANIQGIYKQKLAQAYSIGESTGSCLFSNTRPSIKTELECVDGRRILTNMEITYEHSPEHDKRSILKKLFYGNYMDVTDLVIGAFRANIVPDLERGHRELLDKIDRLEI